MLAVVVYAALALVFAVAFVRSGAAFRLAYNLYCTRLGLFLFRRLSTTPACAFATTTTTRWTSFVEIHTVPLFGDNFSYVIANTREQTAAVVDPADPGTVLALLCKFGLKLDAVLTTHKHWDHAAGNATLAAAFPDARVFGGEPVLALTDLVGDGAEIVAAGVRFRCVRTGGHTAGHVAFLAMPPSSEPASPAAMFSGDSLFVGGCGRLFESTPAVGLAALRALTAASAPSTLLFPGHEYTVRNLEFALTIVPHDEAVTAKLAWARRERAAGRPTVPSTLGEEAEHNVFLGCARADLQTALGASDELSAFARLRLAKDRGLGAIARAADRQPAGDGKAQ